MEETIIQTEERVCRDCGNKLGAGREDRQYCDDGCRTNYNNRKRRESLKEQGQSAPEAYLQENMMQPPGLSVPQYITRIQEILLRNRSIMESICDEDRPGRIRYRNLIGRGFNIKYFTSEAEPTEAGNVYRFCFEYGYRKDEEGMVIIVCRKRELF